MTQHVLVTLIGFLCVLAWGAFAGVVVARIVGVVPVLQRWLGQSELVIFRVLTSALTIGTVIFIVTTFYVGKAPLITSVIFTAIAIAGLQLGAELGRKLTFWIDAKLFRGKLRKGDQR